MLRRIIKIDEDKCSGCGLCADACHEGAIGMVNGKAKLLREDYCDGLGDCLPACPETAISFEMREAPAYNAAAVLAAKRAQTAQSCMSAGGCPGSACQTIHADATPPDGHFPSCLGNFHQDFIRGRVTLIGCPKLDNTQYATKLAAIFTMNDIRSIILTRMTVPCCGGLAYAVQTALDMCGKDIPLRIVSIAPDGKIIS